MPYELIGSYLSDTSTEAERKIIENWINDSEENKVHFEELATVWEQTGTSRSSFTGNAEAAWENIELGIAPHAKPRPLTKGVKVRNLDIRQGIYTLLKVASVLALVFGAYMWKNGPNDVERFAALTEVVTAKGERLELILNDGTRVWLNADSKLQYPNVFSDGERDISLIGEAYFDVAKDSLKPFTVQAEGVVVTVLGTSFNVKAYSEDENVAVTVATGRVSVSVKNASDHGLGRMVLTPGEEAHYIKRDAVVKKGVPTSVAWTAWKEQKIVFEQTSMADVVLILERWYNIEVHIEDEMIHDCHLTAEFSNENLQDVMKVIEMTMNVQISRTGSLYVMSGEGCW